MPTLRFTRHLLRYFPTLPASEGLSLPGQTVAEVLDALEAAFPGMDHYLRDEAGALRKHVNVFVDGELVRDLEALADPLRPDAELMIIQALSGG